MINVVYRYLRAGQLEEMYLDDIDEAFNEAMYDIEHQDAAPFEITEHGRVVMDYCWLMKAYDEGFRDERPQSALIVRPPLQMPAKENLN